MSDNGKVRVLSTIKKDEAAFYLSELARGLLKNRVNLRVGELHLVMAAFDPIRMEMKALDKNERYAVDIHLSWRKPAPSFNIEGANGHALPDTRVEQILARTRGTKAGGSREADSP
jgi:amphi-Trp domain-containing protein